MLKERRQVRWPSSAATTARVEHSVVNQLVEALRRTDREYLAAACVTVQLVLGEVLHEPGALLRHAYFSPGGFISLLSTTDQHTPLELGLNGDDGCWHASAQSPDNPIQLKCCVVLSLDHLLSALHNFYFHAEFQ